jgi:AbrB family looped-hinge helix DNA binding protein
MSDVTTLSAKFRISIPKAVRSEHSWKPGQTFAFVPRGSGVLLVPIPELEDLKGIARGAHPDDYRDR